LKYIFNLNLSALVVEVKILFFVFFQKKDCNGKHDPPVGGERQKNNDY